MMSLDQIHREIKALEEFDSEYLSHREHYPDEIVGFELRQIRRQELLELAKSQGWES